MYEVSSFPTPSFISSYSMKFKINVKISRKQSKQTSFANNFSCLFYKSVNNQRLYHMAGLERVACLSRGYFQKIARKEFQFQVLLKLQNALKFQKLSLERNIRRKISKSENFGEKAEKYENKYLNFSLLSSKGIKRMLHRRRQSELFFIRSIFSINYRQFNDFLAKKEEKNKKENRSVCDFKLIKKINRFGSERRDISGASSTVCFHRSLCH